MFSHTKGGTDRWLNGGPPKCKQIIEIVAILRDYITSKIHLRWALIYILVQVVNVSVSSQINLNVVIIIIYLLKVSMNLAM